MDSFRSTHPQPASPPSPETLENRDGHLIRLLFETRQLAMKQFRNGLFHDHGEASLAPGAFTESIIAENGLDGFTVRPVCKECEAAQADALKRLDHAPGCTVGAVLQRLETLQAGVCEEAEASRVVSMPSPSSSPCLGLPLRVVRGHSVTVEDSDGRVIVDMVGSDVVEREETEWALRIAASVNACAVLTIDSLQAIIRNRMARAALLEVYGPGDAAQRRGAR